MRVNKLTTMDVQDVPTVRSGRVKAVMRTLGSAATALDATGTKR